MNQSMNHRHILVRAVTMAALLIMLTAGTRISLATPGDHVDWQVLGSAGGPVTSSGHKLFSVTGQPTPVGEATNGSHSARNGYWQSFGAGSPPWICGDSDGSGGVDIDDVVFLIGYIFASGPPPVPIEAGDANCSGGGSSIDIDDVVYLITYIFLNGPAPCASCR